MWSQRWPAEGFKPCDIKDRLVNHFRVLIEKGNCEINL
jgi:hypothetical protein